MQRILILLSSLCLILLFQNCQKAVTHGSADGSEKALEGELSPIDMSEQDDDVEDGITQGRDPDDSENDDDIGNDNETPTGNPDDNSGENANNGHQGNDGNESNTGHPGKGNHSGNYVCILEGPGNSIRLGLVSEGLSGKHGTPSVLCMSKSACLEIASQAFPVKSAKVSNGYCKDEGGNPHVIHITDAELQAKIDGLRAAR
ncbi:MAG: hypothetical protein AB7G93_08460 [Bdellovibrionales bacterium]